jgi:hypothetical protein
VKVFGPKQTRKFISIFCHSTCWGVGRGPKGSGAETLPQAVIAIAVAHAKEDIRDEYLILPSNI